MEIANLAICFALTGEAVMASGRVGIHSHAREGGYDGLAGMSWYVSTL
jgi:hypothetical protein